MQFDALKKSWLFRGLSQKQIGTLLEGIPYTIMDYQKEETVFYPMETAEQVGVILQGKVQSYKQFPNGNQINVTIRTKGDIIGPAAAFSVQRKYPFGVIALEETKVLMFRRGDYLHLLQSDPRLVENAFSEIATITYLLQQRLELLSYHGISQKIAFYLLSESLQNGTDTVSIPDSMAKWALMMNVSRPSLYRELKKLDEQGITLSAPHEVKILQAAALETILRK